MEKKLSNVMFNELDEEFDEYNEDEYFDDEDFDNWEDDFEWDDEDEEDDGPWSVCTNASGDSDWCYFNTEEEAREYYESQVIEVEADPENFGTEYTIQLWFEDELIDEFSIEL